MGWRYLLIQSPQNKTAPKWSQRCGTALLNHGFWGGRDEPMSRPEKIHGLWSLAENCNHSLPLYNGTDCDTWLYSYIHMVYIYITCMYVCLSVCLSVCMHACMHACMYVCMIMYDSVWLCMIMYDYVCICMYMYEYVCICMYMYVYVCICMYMYVYVCIYM